MLSQEQFLLFTYFSSPSHTKLIKQAEHIYFYCVFEVTPSLYFRQKKTEAVSWGNP